MDNCLLFANAYIVSLQHRLFALLQLFFSTSYCRLNNLFHLMLGKQATTCESTKNVTLKSQAQFSREWISWKCNWRSLLTYEKCLPDVDWAILALAKLSNAHESILVEDDWGANVAGIRNNESVIFMPGIVEKQYSTIQLCGDEINAIYFNTNHDWGGERDEEKPCYDSVLSFSQAMLQNQFQCSFSCIQIWMKIKLCSLPPCAACSEYF